MVLTSDAALNKRLRSLRWLGIDKDTWSRSGGKYAWRYSISELGYKYHMNDITAVIGLAQLETLAEDNALRRKGAERYAKAFAGNDGLKTPVERPYAKSSWHNYVIKLKTAALREDFIAHLASQGISAGVHYEPVHLHKVFDGKSRADNLPNAEKIWPSLVTLPLYPGLSSKDQDLVIDTTVRFLAENKIAH
jgi:dTDP-4-amino-4,6-dideoxygalactose transaminase